MTSFGEPAALVHAARIRSGLSQRELARKAGTAQSVVARIELGETSPSWSTLTRLLKAAGFRLASELRRTNIDPQLLDDVPRILRLTPEQRLREIAHAAQFISAARRV